MNRGSVLLGGAEPDGGADGDDRGLVLDLLGALDGRQDARDVVVAVGDAGDVPAVGLVALERVLGEGDVGAAVDGDGVVVVENDQTAKLEVPGEARGLVADALFQAAVAAERVDVVVDHWEVRLVEQRRQVRLSDRHAHGVRDALAQRTGGHLHAHHLRLGMAGRAAAQLAEGFQIINGHLRIRGSVESARRNQ